MITVAEASQLAVVWDVAFIDRVATFLLNRARSGLVGGDYSYSGETRNEVLRAVQVARDAGWIVTHDDVNKLLQFRGA